MIAPSTLLIMATLKIKFLMIVVGIDCCKRVTVSFVEGHQNEDIKSSIFQNYTMEDDNEGWPTWRGEDEKRRAIWLAGGQWWIGKFSTIGQAKGYATTTYTGQCPDKLQGVQFSTALLYFPIPP